MYCLSVSVCPAKQWVLPLGCERDTTKFQNSVTRFWKNLKKVLKNYCACCPSLCGYHMQASAKCINYLPANLSQRSVALRSLQITHKHIFQIQKELWIWFAELPSESIWNHFLVAPNESSTKCVFSICSDHWETHQRLHYSLQKWSAVLTCEYRYGNCDLTEFRRSHFPI